MPSAVILRATFHNDLLIHSFQFGGIIEIEVMKSVTIKGVTSEKKL